MTEERFAEVIAENAELRKRRDELLRENNRLVEERRALVGLSPTDINELARVSYDAYIHANNEPDATDWAWIGYFPQKVWESTVSAVVVAVRAKIRAQERKAIIDLLGGGDDERHGLYAREREGGVTAEQLKEQGNLIQYFEERLQKLQAENSRLREALELIAEGRDAGRSDGLLESCPIHDNYAMFAIARCALGTMGEIDWKARAAAVGVQVAELAIAQEAALKALNNTAIIAEIRELRADRERLDWLEQRAKLDRIGIECEGDVNMPFCLREVGWFEDYSDISDGATLRAAIDAAHVHATRTEGDGEQGVRCE